MLKVALLGAPHTGKSRLATSMKSPVEAAGWKVAITVLELPGCAAELAGCGLTLLMGLNAPRANHEPSDASSVSAVPGDTGPCQAKAQAMSQTVADQSIRAELAQANVAYQVMYGSDDERLALALRAIEQRMTPATRRPQQGLAANSNPPDTTASGATRTASAWVWVCDKCSDPQCEHRLLTDLLARRAPGV